METFSPVASTIISDVQDMDLPEMMSFAASLPFSKHAEVHHPVVQKIVDACTVTTYAYNNADTLPPGQYDPACLLWKTIDMTFDNQWSQGILVIVFFSLPVFGTFTYALILFIMYASRTLFSPNTEDMQRYNNFSG